MTTEEYDKKILKRLQNTELEILKDFVKICDKYNLPYFATGGTAIGALRHKGFIPWDDDIDVCMLRKDYDLFMKIAPKEMGDRYIFMSTETEPKYPLMFGKMVKRGTRFIEKAYQQADYPLGIYIDIFPYDKTSEDLSVRKKLQKKTWNWGRIHVLTLIPNPNLPDNIIGWKKNVILFLCRIVYYFFKLIRLTPQKTARQYLKWARKYENSASDLYIDYSYLTGERLMIRESQMYPLKKVQFEDMELSLVREYDSFLRPEYGDYMQLPPEDERHNHYASYIDFGDNKEE